MPEAGSADPRHLAVLRPVTGADLADLTTWQERDLPGAIESGQLALRYQPIVDLPDGRIVAVEALATWDHPEHGMIPPDEFIEVAERSDVILTLGAWVLDTACAQVRAWQISTPALRNLRVAVNVSARQLDADLPATVQRARDRSGLAPECLEIEVTESTVIADLHGALQVLATIGRLGVGLSIDDFGTGFSSLAHLKQLPVTTLKIDPTFIDDLSDDPRDVSIVAAIIALAAALGLSQVAEGVETEGQRQKLEALGCAHAQGYLFSRPLWPEAFVEEVTPLLAAPPSSPPGPGRPLPRVLLCDDEASIRRLYHRALQSCDVDLLDAVDAEDCLAKAAAFLPHVVVLDVTLPGRSGLEIIEDIRRVCPARVIVISGVMTATTIEHALAMGAEACFAKMQFLPRLRSLVDEIVL